MGKRGIWIALGAAVVVGILVFLIARPLLTPRPPAPPPDNRGPLLRPMEPSALRVGFWNIRDFSSSSRNSEELKLIARVAHKIDCLAICELNDTQVLKSFARELAALGGEWEGVQTTSKSGNTAASSEYYGFVYRSDKLRVRSPPRILPEIQYSVPGESGTRGFDRDPATCAFATRDGHLDFTMIVVHITWGTKVAYRRGEIRALREHFLRVRDEDPEDDDVILGGDFNRDVGDEAFADLLSIPTMVDTTEPSPPTVVKGTSTYDHILFQRRFLTEYTGSHGVEAFDETLFGGDDARARTAVSDHRPVWILLEVPAKDDD